MIDKLFFVGVALLLAITNPFQAFAQEGDINNLNTNDLVPGTVNDFSEWIIPGILLFALLLIIGSIAYQRSKKGQIKTTTESKI